MNQEKNKCLLQKKSKRYFHLQTLIVISLIILYIGTTSFNSFMSVNSTCNIKYKQSTGFEAFPKRSDLILPVKPILHPIDSPNYDAPYDVSLSWNPLINATKVQIFRSNSKNYSAAVQIGYNFSQYAISYVDSQGQFEGKILGETYYYFIKAFNEEASINSNWQNVTLPQVLFEQPLEIKLSYVRFTVKSLANLTDLKVYYYKIGEEGESTYYSLGPSSQKSEDGYYTISRKITFTSKGPLYYWYRGDLQGINSVNLGNRSHPLKSTEDIKLTTEHFKIIVQITSVIAVIIVEYIVKKKTKSTKYWEN